jgi:hypothetical protein
MKEINKGYQKFLLIRLKIISNKKGMKILQYRDPSQNLIRDKFHNQSL